MKTCIDCAYGLLNETEPPCTECNGFSEHEEGPRVIEDYQYQIIKCFNFSKPLRIDPYVFTINQAGKFTALKLGTKLHHQFYKAIEKGEIVMSKKHKHIFGPMGDHSVTPPIQVVIWNIL